MKKFLFIRHSLAVEAYEFKGHDFDRPLTPKGKIRAKGFFRVVKKIYPVINYIITSKAIRAKETAEILKEFYPESVFIETELLFPGANFKNFKEIVENKNGIIAIVGHQPDLSEFISKLTHSDCYFKLSKPSLAEVEDNILKALFSYKHFRNFNESDNA
ncbi:phosphohistidine phosphatase [Lebetimonas natsushimae]|uniref:Phosphohistidine phosphatase n=1 Tax=Lebetimonas natsushimae TaxID=1936991 RepID=A0A292YGT3_9BACT|nr:histidine phosphatase family protein [Lebetimonas natsushimae]GAX88201.1 phosphohistidine phosphatase [Lebetimonas natsushimae]